MTACWMTVASLVHISVVASLPIELPLSAKDKAVLQKRAVVRTAKDGVDAGKPVALGSNQWITDHEGWCTGLPATFECSLPYAPNPTYLSILETKMGDVLDPALAKLPCVKAARDVMWQMKGDPVQNSTPSVDPRRLRWLHDVPVDPCAELAARNVKTMLFIGDSYVRMVFQTMGMWLSNNYRNASMRTHAADGPINKCNRGEYILPEMKVCSGAVTLRQRDSYHPAARPLPGDVDNYDVMVWGLGNHPVDGYLGQPEGVDGGHYGVNTASLYNSNILEPTCNCKPHSPPLIPREAGTLKDAFEKWSNEFECVGSLASESELNSASSYILRDSIRKRFTQKCHEWREEDDCSKDLIKGQYYCMQRAKVHDGKSKDSLVEYTTKQKLNAVKVQKRKACEKRNAVKNPAYNAMVAGGMNEESALAAYVLIKQGQASKALEAREKAQGSNSGNDLDSKGEADGSLVRSQCWKYVGANPNVGITDAGCKPWTPEMSKKVIWLQPHYRPSAGSYKEETRTMTDKFAVEMPKFLKSTCGVQHVVNPYGFTKALVERTHATIIKIDPTYEAVFKSKKDADGKMKMDCPKQLSGDMRHLTECYGMHEDPSHWGMAVNIVKAHLVFAEIQKMHSKKT